LSSSSSVSWNSWGWFLRVADQHAQRDVEVGGPGELLQRDPVPPATEQVQLAVDGLGAVGDEQEVDVHRSGA